MADPNNSTWQPDPQGPQPNREQLLANLAEQIRSLVRLVGNVAPAPQEQPEGTTPPERPGDVQLPHLEDMLERLLQIFSSPSGLAGKGKEAQTGGPDPAITTLHAIVSALISRLSQQLAGPAANNVSAPTEVLTQLDQQLNNPASTPPSPNPVPNPEAPPHPSNNPTTVLIPPPFGGDNVPYAEVDEEESPGNKRVEELLQEILEALNNKDRKEQEEREKEKPTFGDYINKVFGHIHEYVGASSHEGFGEVSDVASTATKDLVKGANYAAMIPVIGEAASALMLGTAVLTGFVAAISGALDALKRWGDNLHQANMQFAEFSAAMAGVKALDTARRIDLNRQRGDRRADTARDLANVRYELDRKLYAPFEDALANFKNELFAILGNEAIRLTDIAKNSGGILGFLSQRLMPDYKDQPNATALARHLQNIANNFIETAPVRHRGRGRV